MVDGQRKIYALALQGVRKIGQVGMRTYLSAEVVVAGSPDEACRLGRQLLQERLGTCWHFEVDAAEVPFHLLVECARQALSRS